MNDNGLERIWSKCLEFIKDNVSLTVYNTWFADITALKLQDKELTIQVPSPFVYEYLEANYLGILKMAITQQIGEGAQLMYSVITDKGNDIKAEYKSVNHTIDSYKDLQVSTNRAPGIIDAPKVQDLDPMLNPNYNFDTFIEGVSNKLARTAAEAVSKNPGYSTFNPLFIYGESGVGKTHIANAIGIKVKELFPSKRVLYVSTHLLYMQYADAVRNNIVSDFINFYQTIDVLIIDDLQELETYVKTQNPLFHIFNHLHLNHKQLILTSDRPPKDIKSLEDRLLSRFKWGLVAQLDKPDLELRKRILREKTRRDGITLPDDVIDFIAENVVDNARNLEGAIVSLMAYATTFNRDIDIKLAKVILEKCSLIEERPLTIDDIVQRVCAHFKIDAKLLQTKSRKRDIVQARQVSMFLAKKHLDCSTAQIGTNIGSRDHATVLHAINVVRNQLEIDRSFKDDVSEIESSLSI